VGGGLAIFGEVSSVSGVSNPADQNKGASNVSNQLIRPSKCRGVFQGSPAFSPRHLVSKARRSRGKQRGQNPPTFDIIVPSGQINGQAETGRIVMVSKAKGGCAPFVLVEQLESAYSHTPEGVALTTWRGELVQH